MRPDFGAESAVWGGVNSSLNGVKLLFLPLFRLAF
jgi:hypothetical protein